MSCSPYLCQPITKALFFFYNLFGQNLGWAIIGLTVAIRGLLTPLTAPSLKAGQKMKELQPELNQLKEKYGRDKQLFAKKQLELFQSHGVNPAAGCLPQIIQIIILIALFQAFQSALIDGSGLNTRFLYLDLTKPDMISIPPVNLFGLTVSKLPGIFLILAAAVQFLSSKLMLPASQKEKKIAKETPGQADDMAAAMQTQMLYLFPLMTLLIGFRFPSGLVLYWLVFSLMMLFQQLWLNYEKRS